MLAAICLSLEGARCFPIARSRRATVRSFFGFSQPRPASDGDEMAEKLGVQLPKFEVILSGEGWELRRYQRFAVVECEYEKRPEGYELLAGYCKRGENDAGLPMPATAPCLMMPLASRKKMWYILPSPHTPRDPTAEPIPPPQPLATELLTCRTVEGLTVAVGRFSGYAVPDVVFSRRDELIRSVEDAGVELLAEASTSKLLLAQYNELFALPWNRDNEIWLQVVPPDELEPSGLRGGTVSMMSTDGKSEIERRLATTLLLSGVGLALVLALGVATVLGFGVDPTDTSNRGLGTPLSLRESEALVRSRDGEARGAGEAILSSEEELLEEQALLDIILGVNVRKK